MICLAEKKRNKHTALTPNGGKEMNIEHRRKENKKKKNTPQHEEKETKYGTSVRNKTVASISQPLL